MRSRLLVVAREFGSPSEPWIWRQVRGFERLSPSVLTWQRHPQAALAGEAVEIETLPFEPGPENAPGLARWLYRLRCIRARNFYASVGKERREIERRVRQQEPAVILAQYGFVALRILPVARSLDLPVVAHFHGLDVASLLRNRWYRWSLERHMRRFSAMVVVGNHQRAKLVELGAAPERVHLIPCGVPVSDFTPRDAASESTVRFLAVGRLVESKGLEWTLEAFATLHRKGSPRVELTIVGDGPEREKLERKARVLGIREQVHFSGAAPWDEMPARYRQADVFVQHSVVDRWGEVEGFGVSLAEAAASGLPVVSTRCGGIVDQVVEGRTGFLVEQRDVAAMAACMVRLAGDPVLRREMGREGRAHMERNFDTRAQIRKLEDVLLASLRGRGLRQGV